MTEWLFTVRSPKQTEGRLMSTFPTHQQYVLIRADDLILERWARYDWKPKARTQNPMKRGKNRLNRNEKENLGWIPDLWQKMSVGMKLFSYWRFSSINKHYRNYNELERELIVEPLGSDKELTSNSNER